MRMTEHSGSDDIPIRMGIVGGGSRCRMLLEMFDRQEFHDFKGVVVGVADVDPKAPGMLKARDMGIITSDPERLMSRQDVDLYVELTGEPSVRERLEHIRVGKYFPAITKLFYDILRVRSKELETEDELEQTYRLLKTMFDSIQEDIMVVDPNYIIVDVNETMIRNSGLPKTEIVGRYCYQVSHRSLTPCQSPDHPCPMKEVLATGRPVSTSHKHFTKEGRRYFEVVHYPIKDKQGRITLVLEMARDISEILNTRIKRTEERLKQDYSRLVMEDKMISLGKLMASTVHEINNPLSGTLNLARLVLANLEESPGDPHILEENREYLRIVCSELDRCSKIVANLLFFSRQQPRELHRVRVEETVERVLAIAQHKIRLQQIEVSRSYAAPEGAEIAFEGGQLDQALMNVIFNALEAMPSGGQLTVSTRLDRDLGEVVISIKDTGHGISKTDMSRIFEPFFSTKGEGKGVGLGLSVVLGIVKAHGGSIDFDSTPGQGTECVMRFPLPKT